MGLSQAGEPLPNRLKQYQGNLSGKVSEELIAAAKANDRLDELQLHEAAILAARHKQWSIAGFYYIAAFMRQKMDGYIFEPLLPESLQNKSQQERDLMSSKEIHKAMKKDRRFRELLNANQKRGDVISDNAVIKQYLLTHVDVLQSVIELYSQWQPVLDKSYQPNFPFKRRLTESEAQVKFKQLNDTYLKSNNDILKLIGTPEYAKLVLKKDKLLSKQINGSINMKKMQEVVKLTREIEDIEMEHLLFPEKDWGWFR